jgi:hypothetical protein
MPEFAMYLFKRIASGLDGFLTDGFLSFLSKAGLGLGYPSFFEAAPGFTGAAPGLGDDAAVRVEGLDVASPGLSDVPGLEEAPGLFALLVGFAEELLFFLSVLPFPEVLPFLLLPLFMFC